MPTNFVHEVHVDFDPVSGAFTVILFYQINKVLVNEFFILIGFTTRLGSFTSAFKHYKRRV
jgi:hypothetical protein